MARPRKPPPTAYERRNARARALGYRNYYDYRLHANGRVAPGPLRLSTPERARLRGHRGRADFLASLGEGDLIVLPQGLASIERDSDGKYVEFDVLVIDGSTGKERTYTLRNLTPEQLHATLGNMDKAGAVFSPSPSLDLRRLPPEDDLQWEEAA